MKNAKTPILSNYPLDTKIKCLVVSLLLFASVLLPRLSSAQGVTAGTEISNMAVVRYQVDNIDQDPIESSPTGNSSPNSGNGTATTFKVDRRIDLIVTGNNDASVAPGDLQAEVTFTLLNEGNDIQTFQLIADGALTADNFDTSNCSVTVTAVSGSPLAGVILPTLGDIKLSPDQQAIISVKCDIPFTDNSSSIMTNDISLVSLTAITVKNGDGSTTEESNTADNQDIIETVYADNAGTDDSTNDAHHSARRTYTATTGSVPPTLSINKGIVEVIDLNGGNSAISGSEVIYKITVATQGMGSLDNVVITDITPADMSYKTSSIILDGTVLTDSVDADEADYGVTAAQTITVNLGNINAGDHHEIKITYIIN